MLRLNSRRLNTCNKVKVRALSSLNKITEEYDRLR